EFLEFPISQIRVSEYPEAGLSPNFIYELPAARGYKDGLGF
ncbi:unnamed protein product, partial [Linum tenue]